MAKSKVVLALAVFVVLMLQSVGLAQDTGTLLNNLQSPDPATRSAAFYALVAATHGNDPQINLALVNLLTTENTYLQTLTDGKGDYGEYYLDVVTFVCSLKDPRSVTPLLDAIDTGNMVTDTLAGLGSVSVNAVLARLADRSVLVRYSVVSVLTKMLTPVNFSKLTVTAAQSAASGLASVTTDADPNVRALGLQGLAAAGQLSQFPESLPASSGCNGVFNGSFIGDLTVSPGQNCVFLSGSIGGNIMQKGGNLVLANVSVQGNVQIRGGETFSIGPATTIHGNLESQNIPTSSIQDYICASTVTGNVEVHDNGVPVAIGTSSSLISCAGSEIAGNLEVHNNAGSTSVVGNTISGNLDDHNNTAPTQIFRNIVINNLQCGNNSSIAGSGNTAKQKQGQCAGF